LNRIRSLVNTKFDSAVVEALDRAVREGKIRLSPSLVEV
jgi:hypothetical protein